VYVAQLTFMSVSVGTLPIYVHNTIVIFHALIYKMITAHVAEFDQYLDQLVLMPSITLLLDSIIS